MAYSISQLSIDDTDNYVMVAAIDFGTTFSGYAFSFKSSPDDVKMNKSWGAGLGFQSYKTSTSVLVDPRGKFVAFGFEAEQKYSEIIEEEKNQGEHQMFRHFKMMLHKTGVTRHSTIESTGGLKRNAMEVFVMALQYLKKHLLEAVGRYTTNSPDGNMIKWVLTVPAIWTDEAKQFMREASFKAGLIKTQDSKKLLIALEPEAASLYCRNLDLDNFVCGANIKALSFRAGTKYLVIDAGGGTIDITAHEILPSGQIKELHAANGGAWGGTKVDANFVKLLTKIFGSRFINIYIKECPQQWLTLMTAFERAKKCAKPDDTSSKIVIPVGYSMGGKYAEVMKGDLEKAIKASSNIGVAFSNGSLIIKHEAVIALFKPVTDQIIHHISTISKLGSIKDCRYYLLVGGFGECEFLQKGITSAFPNVTVLTPHEAQMSVTKGAVCFGHRPLAIKSRIARKTYGKEYLIDFDDDKHNPNYKEKYGSIVKCGKLFRTFVQKGDEIEIGSVVTQECVPVEAHQKNMFINLHAVDRKCSEIEYVDTAGFVKVGDLLVDMPDTTGGKDRVVDLEIEFGGTEIRIVGTDRLTRNTANTSIDFLAD